MTAVYAMNDYRRTGFTGNRRGSRRRQADDPTPPPPMKVRPPMFAHLAVPGSSSALVGGELVSVVALEENLQPGTVADWVSCAVCGATWDERTGHGGGVLMVRRWNAVTGAVRKTAAACRCAAGLRLGLMPVTDGEWRRAVASARRATRIGVNALTEETMMRYLIAPRGEFFQGRWGYYAETLTARGIRSDVAIRRAYVKVWQQVMR